MSRKVSPIVAYAIVRAGGRQEKVSVGDLVTLDRVAGEPGSTIELPVLLLVDGDKVTADAKSLASAKVVAEKVEDLRVRRSLFRSTRTRPVTRSVRASALS